MTPIGIGIVGCGDIARARFFPVIARAPGFELRGLQSRSASGHASRSPSNMAEPIYPDLDGLLTRERGRGRHHRNPASHSRRSRDPLSGGGASMCSAKSRWRRRLADAVRIEEAVGAFARGLHGASLRPKSGGRRGQAAYRLRRHRTRQHGGRSAGASRPQTRALVLRRAEGALGGAGRSRRLSDQSADLPLRAGATSFGERSTRFSLSAAITKADRLQRRSTTTPPRCSNCRNGVLSDGARQLVLARPTIATSSVQTRIHGTTGHDFHQPRVEDGPARRLFSRA